MSLNLPEHPSHEFLKTIARQRVAGGSTGLHVEHGRGSIRGGPVFSVLWRATVQHPGHQRADVDLLAARVARAERGCVAV